jgi:hypothetical protein
MALSAVELDKVRAGLAGGRRPKVMFTAAAGQIAGQLGQVVALTDPAESDEWVVVRFGRDELPFSPGDLQVPPRGKPARPTPPPAPARPPEPEFVIDKPLPASARRSPRAAVNGHAGEVPASSARASSPGRSPSSPSSASPSSASPSSASPSSAARSAAAPSAAAPSAAAPSAAAPSAAASASPSPGSPSRGSRSPGSSSGSGSAASPAAVPGVRAPAPRRESADTSAASSGAPSPAPRKQTPAGAARKPKGKPSPALTVTLAYAEGEWTVAAAQGSKTLARPYVVKPAEAMRMVALVDVPGVQEAVEQIVAAEQAEAEEQAERLRAQLAEVESRLAELRDARP